MYNVHVHLGFFDYFAKFSTRKLLVEFPIGLIIMISSTACHFVPPLSLQNWKICARRTSPRSKRTLEFFASAQFVFVKS